MRVDRQPEMAEEPPAPDLWDRQLWDLAGQVKPLSTIRVRLGSIPILPDLRPEPEPAEVESHARREAAGRAGHCGTAGDDMA